MHSSLLSGKKKVKPNRVIIAHENSLITVKRTHMLALEELSIFLPYIINLIFTSDYSLFSAHVSPLRNF